MVFATFFFIHSLQKFDLVDIYVVFFSAPSYGGIIAQLPLLNAVLLIASITRSLRPLPLLLKKTSDRSIPSLDLMSEPNKEENELRKSICETISSETCGFVFPFQ